MKNFCKITCLTIAAAASLVLKADYKFSTITNGTTGATVTTILVPDGSPVATSNMLTRVAQLAVREAVSTAKEYTDDAIAGGGDGTGSDLKVPTGGFVSHIAFAPLYNGVTNGSPLVSGCWLTNIVLNATDGSPQSLTVHLNGLICGRVFDNEEIELSRISGNSVMANVEYDTGSYTMSYNTQIYEAVRGFFTIVRSSPYAEVGWTSFSECREFTNILSEVDVVPTDGHDKSLVTSKGVYDAVADKISQSGGNMHGNIKFDTSASLYGWKVPTSGATGASQYSTGTASKDGIVYAASIGVGERDPSGVADIKYPAYVKLQRSSSDPVQEHRLYYDFYGIEQLIGSLSGNAFSYASHRLLFPTNESGALLDGTIARIEDLAFTNSLSEAISSTSQMAADAVNSVQELRSSGLKSPYGFDIQSNGTQISSYDGSAVRTLNFGDGISADANGATTTVSVDRSTIATQDDLSEVSETGEKRLFADSSAPADTVTAVYIISNTNDKTEYKVAVSTINGEWGSTESSFLQIDNPSVGEGTNSKRGWMKANMFHPQGGITNWTLYVSIGSSQPTTWDQWYSVSIGTTKSIPIFPLNIGQQMPTYNSQYYVRKIAQFRGTASGYLSGDCGIYSITGEKTNSVVNATQMASSIEAAVSPVRVVANSASSGVNTLNGKMTSVENTIGNLKTVATSGRYADLTGKPTNVSDFNNDEGYVKAIEITQDYLQEKGMATQQSLEQVKSSIEFIVPHDLSHVVDADLNIYSAAYNFEYVTNDGQTAWKHLQDSEGHSYTCKSSYALQGSPVYVYFRYSRDGDSQTLVNSGSGQSSACYTNGLVIIKRAVYDQYNLVVYDDSASESGRTMTTFTKSSLDAVGGHVTIDGVNYYAKRNISKGSEVLDRLSTTNYVSNYVSGFKVDRLYDKGDENWGQYISGDLGIYDSESNRIGKLIFSDAEGIVKFSDWNSLVVTNLTGEKQNLTAYIKQNTVTNDFIISEPTVSMSGSTATYTLADKTYNYATRGNENFVNFVFPVSSESSMSARIFYFCYECDTTGIMVKVPTESYKFYVPVGEENYLTPTNGMTIYRFEEVKKNNFSITVSHRVELQ